MYASINALHLMYNIMWKGISLVLTPVKLATITMVTMSAINVTLNVKNVMVLLLSNAHNAKTTGTY